MKHVRIPFALQGNSITLRPKVQVIYPVHNIPIGIS